MTNFDIGLLPGTIYQYAYTVPDAVETALRYTEVLGIGPWFVRGPFVPPAATYRGRPSTAEVTLARAFNGHAQIELVQQHNDVPSVYLETIEKSGYGFHHWAVGVTDAAAEIARYRALGFEVAFSDTLPSGASVDYVDTTPALAGMMEIVGVNPEQVALINAIQAASVDWDGQRPIREG